MEYKMIFETIDFGNIKKNKFLRVLLCLIVGSIPSSPADALKNNEK